MTEAELKALYPNVIDKTLLEADRIVQGVPRALRVHLGSQPVESGDKFYIAFRYDFTAPNAYLVLDNDQISDGGEENARYLDIEFPLREIAELPLNGAGIHQERNLWGVLRHTTNEGVSRSYSGRVLIGVRLVYSWGRP